MKTRGFLLIGISLLFAVMMIGIAQFISDQETKSLVTFMLIAIWWIPFTILSGQENCDCHPETKKINEP